MRFDTGVWFLAALSACSAVGCRREPPPPSPSASAPDVTAKASSPLPSAAIPSASVAAADQTLGDVDAWDFTLSGKRLTLIVPRTGERALVIDPTMGEWSSLMVIREGETVTVSDVPGVLTLTYTGAKGEGTLTLGGAAATRVPIKVRGSDPAGSSPIVVPTLAGDAEAPRVLGRHGAVLLAWSDGFLPGFPSLPTPTRMPMGAATVTPSPVPAAKVLGCVVRGARPGAVAGPLEDALRETFERETQSVCKAHGGHAVLESSYSLVRFSGVNQLEGGRAPSPTDVIAMTLLHRATNEEGSTIVETGFLIGLAKPAVVSLRSLLAPAGATWLSRAARTAAEIPKGLSAPLVIDANAGGLSVGASTIDVVIDTLPYGLFLRTRRIGIGPRSVTAPAFVDGPLTRRMLAMVNVDY